MTQLNSSISKTITAVRTASVALIKKIRQTIECTVVYNSSVVAYPIGTIVSFYEQVDGANFVRDTTDDGALAPAINCKQQYCGVLEAALPAISGGVPGVALARHDGGPVFVRMDAGLDPEVGDSIWATTAGGYGQLIGDVTSATPIYVGMIHSITGYNPLAAAGTTGVMAILKHDAPTIER